MWSKNLTQAFGHADCKKSFFAGEAIFDMPVRRKLRDAFFGVVVVIISTVVFMSFQYLQS